MSPAPKFSPQEQEALILEAAAKCIEATSLLDFTMSAISKEAGLSMGSIYKHIQSKEDVLVALGYQSQVHFKRLVQQVFELELPSVVRIIAVQFVDQNRVSPFSFGPQLETLLGNQVLLKRASPRWVEKFLQTDMSVEKLFLQQVSDACDRGELVVSPEKKTEVVHEIITSLWSICVGHTQVAMQRSAYNIIEPVEAEPIRRDSDSAIVRVLTRLMNTYDWQTPLSEELIVRACESLHEIGLR